MARSIGCAVLLVGDERQAQSGQLLVSILEGAGHKITQDRTIKPDGLQIKGELAILTQSQSSEVIFFTGRTGNALRDPIGDAVRQQLDRRLDGFGDLLRSLLYQQQGSRAMLAQGVAGSIRRKMVFCLPGDLDIIELAMGKLVLPELEHLLDQMIPRA
ncbi:MAG TPA: molybdenum cofactor biosynthesis protein [Candidatus Latescibacteria bacterium]|nr:molybdenum cofactor biosynthesis protein [Candidatus Handelsmanbacteria bacterium]HIL09359.1 molybdenum cofactor biosynthesis protein [Candidatus Latescibacterota bacterium]